MSSFITLSCLYNNFSRNIYICIINIFNPIACLLGGQGLSFYYTRVANCADPEKKNKHCLGMRKSSTGSTEKKHNINHAIDASWVKLFEILKEVTTASSYFSPN